MKTLILAQLFLTKRSLLGLRNYGGSFSATVILDSMGNDVFSPSCNFFWFDNTFRYISLIHANFLLPKLMNPFATLDHGMLTLNRYILLDPPLLFFISASVYTTVKFHNQRDRSVTFYYSISILLT